MADGKGSDVPVATTGGRVVGAVNTGLNKPVFIKYGEDVFFGVLTGFDPVTGLSHVQTPNGLVKDVPKSVEGSDGWFWVPAEEESNGT